MSRDINKFARPEMWWIFKKAVKDKLGLDVEASCVDRNYKEQYAYWLRGREPLHIVNEAMRRAGLPQINQEENKVRVTWTLNSKHVVNLDDERLDNNKSHAIDFFIVYQGKAVWDVKADVNKDNAKDYEQCALIAERIGFKSGMRFKNQDYPHIEI